MFLFFYFVIKLETFNKEVFLFGLILEGKQCLTRIKSNGLTI